MTIVVDASIALKWVVPEAGSIAAVELRASTALTAPGIWIVEAANGLWKYVLRHELDATEAQERLERLRSAPVIASAVNDDIDTAFRLGTELAHPIYDCLYLALALRLDTYVVTADRRFAALAQKRANLTDRVRLLS
jgi:predicted nucleic acid-binding protein